MRPFRLAAVLVLLAACGRGGATIRATLADSALAADTAVSLRVPGAPGDDARRSGGAFLLQRVPPGPVALELRRGGQLLGRAALDSVPRGARIALTALAVDPVTRLIFPRSVALRGTDLLRLNGLRYASEGRLPRIVDAVTTLLARDGAGVALLARPTDAKLPDLRVVISPETQVATADGDPVPTENLRIADSMRVEGRSDGPYVFATRLTVPRQRAAEVGEDAAAAPAEPGEGAEDDEVAELTGTASAPSVAPAPRAGPSRVAPLRRRGAGKWKMRGGGRGRGKRE